MDAHFQPPVYSGNLEGTLRFCKDYAIASPMDLSPLSVYRPPNYPTEQSAKADPSLLRAVPRRWKGNRAVLTALAAALALTQQGCCPRRTMTTTHVGGIKVPDFKTEKEIQVIHSATPKPSPSPKPSPEELPPFTVGMPAPPRIATEAEVSPSPKPSPTPESK